MRLPDNFDSGAPLFRKKVHDLQDLDTLEEMHHSNFEVMKYFNFLLVLDLYIWLGQKYPQAFTEIERARLVKKDVCDLIDVLLEKVQFKSYH